MRSMTGYGQARSKANGASLLVEVRAVNQRFLEVKLNMPRELLPWETELRGLAQSVVHRGKLEIGINRNAGGARAVRVEPNLELAQAYIDGWQKLQKRLGLAGEIDMSWLQGRTAEIMQIVEQETHTAAEIPRVKATLEAALRAFNAEREREGRALARDMKGRVRFLTKQHKRVQSRVKKLKPVFAERLQLRVRDLLDGRQLTEERLLQEVALVADRGDITEELVRLESHLTALLGLLGEASPVGKKIEFLLQETHREFNTIASKSNDLEVTNATLEARGEIEKLREQVQNVE